MSIYYDTGLASGVRLNSCYTTKLLEIGVPMDSLNPSIPCIRGIDIVKFFNPAIKT